MEPSEDAKRPERSLRVNVPEGVRIAPFIDAVLAGHNMFGFQLDFTQLIGVSTPPEANGGQVEDHQVVARVRIPPRLMPQLLETIATQMDKYEATFGSIPRV